MKQDFLKQAEVFVFLSMLFLIVIVIVDQQHRQKQIMKDVALAHALQAYDQANARANEFRYQVVTATDELAQVKRRNPPIIILSEDENEWRFSLGSAVIPEAFEDKLVDEIIPQLGAWSQEYGCDTIEVVGHTDEAYLRGSSSSLDQNLLSYLHGDLRTSEPVAGSNVDLGMLRAISITQLLQSRSATDLPDIEFFHPLSAGQLILPNRRLASHFAEPEQREDAGRRRIEIRLLTSESRRMERAVRPAEQAIAVAPIPGT